MQPHSGECQRKAGDRGGGEMGKGEGGGEMGKGVGVGVCGRGGGLVGGRTWYA